MTPPLAFCAQMANRLILAGRLSPRDGWDLCRGSAEERPDVIHNIERVPLPDSDPIHGPNGPLMRLWRDPA